MSVDVNYLAKSLKILFFIAITAIGGLNQKYLEIKPHGLQVIAEQN